MIKGSDVRSWSLDSSISREWENTQKRITEARVKRKREIGREKERLREKEKERGISNPASMDPCAHRLRCAVPFPLMLLGLLLLSAGATGTLSFLLLDARNSGGSGNGDRVR